MARSKTINQKLWGIHNWVGLYAGVVIAVLSVTGVLALFKVEIDEAVNAGYFKISQPDEPANFHPHVKQLIDSLKSEYGTSNLAYVRPTLDKSKNWIISFGSRGKNILQQRQNQIFFNPYTARVVGIRDYAKSFGLYIRSLHVRLFTGLVGQIWVGFGGLALLISTVTGILIYGGFMKSQFFGAIRSRNLKLKSADYHKMIGMTTLLFNLMIAITGTWLGLQVFLQPALQIKSPERYKRIEKPISKEEDTAYEIDYIQAFETSRALFPDLIPGEMVHSRDGSRTITIVGDVPKTAYQDKINYIVLDKKDYSELARYDIREESLGDKVYYAQEGLHFGNFGGTWVKLIYSFFGITSGVLSILGFVLYLERTKSKQKMKVNYKTTGKKIGLWSLWFTVICVVLYIMTSTLGVIIPTVVVTLVLNGFIVFYLVKYLFIFSKRGFRVLLKKLT